MVGTGYKYFKHFHNWIIENMIVDVLIITTKLYIDKMCLPKYLERDLRHYKIIYEIFNGYQYHTVPLPLFVHISPHVFMSHCAEW